MPFYHADIFSTLASLAWLGDNWGWMLGVLIVVLGLFTIGLSDTLRFSFKRVWAISGVCFDESIRKRVLWITPLAIIGVLGVTQFQRALDEQDAVRQSVKICIFATGVVVILSSIILACTNLPKEIESRVIYTIVTKPTTRLELVLGKVIGFARVSLTIVLIMGMFTWVYMRFSASQKRQQISYRLEEGEVSDTEATRLGEYKRTGLLTARSFWAPDVLNMYGAAPDPKLPYRVISNDGEEDVLAGFLMDRSIAFGPPQTDVQDWAHEGIGANGLAIRVAVNIKRTGPPEVEPRVGGPLGPVFGKQPAGPILQPRVSIDIIDDNYNSEFSSNQLVGATSASDLIANIGEYAKAMKIDIQHSSGGIRLSDPVKQPDGTEVQYAYAWLPPAQAMVLFNRPKFFVRIIGASAHVDYLIGPKPVSCFVTQVSPQGVFVEGPGATEIPAYPGPDKEPQELVFRGKLGLHFDQEMGGGKDAPTATAAYEFHNAPAAMLVENQIPFQLNVEVDRSNSVIESGREDATKLDVWVVDLDTGKRTHLTNPVLVESRLPTFFSIPAEAVSGGNYQILMHCLNSSLTVGLMPGSLQLVQSEQLFEVNLIKSLSIIWMMSILVIILAVLCSTFLSWPIAIVLTVMILLGHWGVDQLADASGPGLGRQIVSDFKFSDVAISNVVSTGVDKLSQALNLLSKVLPDSSRFDAIEDIEQGISISPDRLIQALTVMLGFGAPALVISYLILRGKEVAP
jgi:hypothetical protein